MLATRAYNKGFTLIEVLLSVTVLVLTLGFMAPLTERLLMQNNVRGARDVVSESLRKASIFARSGLQGTAWGVYIEQGKVTVFSGTAYATRQKDLDETTEIASSVTITGPKEIIFTRGSGIPSKVGTIQFENNGDSVKVILNEKGALLYQ
jgi:prepilin-type N-terminal cleavage/methylation domain-containing protein